MGWPCRRPLELEEGLVALDFCRRRRYDRSSCCSAAPVLSDSLPAVRAAVSPAAVGREEGVGTLEARVVVRGSRRRACSSSVSPPPPQLELLFPPLQRCPKLRLLLALPPPSSGGPLRRLPSRRRADALFKRARRGRGRKAEVAFSVELMGREG